MIKSVKIRLKPTKEQEVLMLKSCGASRFAYNWGLARWNEMYENGQKPTKVKVRTEFNQYKKQLDWIREVSSQTVAQAFDDLSTAFKNFFEGNTERPKFKSKRKSKKSFYVRYDALKIKGDTVNLEKIGRVKFKTNYDIPILDKYVNPRCSFDGKYWYLTFGYEHGENQTELKDISVGIDLGLKDLAITNIKELNTRNINKTKTVKALEKKLKRLQRQCSRKYELNKQGQKFIKTSNVIKLERKIKKLQRRLNNIRQNHIHQATNKIVKFKPYRVVMEDLNVSGMMKNKHLAKSIQEQKFFEFKRQMEYKCRFNGIEFITVDRFYPSSKMCSGCGSIKHNLKLKDRIYVCDSCGLVIDRDYNASLNLANYLLV